MTYKIKNKSESQLMMEKNNKLMLKIDREREKRRKSFEIKNPRIWEKTNWDINPKYQNILGNPKNSQVVWIDNWSRGNYAVVYGIEKPSKQGSVIYEEKGTYINVGTKKEALKYQRKYIEEQK